MKSQIKNQIRAYPMVILLLPLVAAILLLDHFFPQEAPNPKEQDYAFVIDGDLKPTSRCERYEAQILAQRDSILLNGEKQQGTWHPAQGTVYLYLVRDSIHPMPVVGDTVVARTAMEQNHNFRRAYAARWTTQPSCCSPPPPSLQKRLYHRLEQTGLEGDELAIIGALTLGYKEDLDPAVKHRFQTSGAAHVLAVSGLHTGILYGLILWLFTIGGRFKPLHEDRLSRCALSLLIIGVMVSYAWITGMTPSVVRAVLMVIIVEIGRMMYRNTVSINSIASAAVLILLVRPSDLWSVSFQLSFAATFAIVLMAGTLDRFLHRQEWKSRITVWIVGMVIVSIAAQLGTLPITMYNFGQVSTYFLLTNLIVLPLATILVPLGLICLALGGTWLGMVAGKITGGVAWLLNHAVGWIEGLPGSTVSASTDGYMIAVYYVLILLFYWIVIKKPR